MIQETFLLEVKPGREEEFELAFKKVTVLLTSANGYLGYELQRCLEKKNKYLVSIKWKTVEDHLIGFKSSTAFQEMKSLIGPYYLHTPQTEHYKQVIL